MYDFNIIKSLNMCDLIEKYTFTYAYLFTRVEVPSSGHHYAPVTLQLAMLWRCKMSNIAEHR